MDRVAHGRRLVVQIDLGKPVGVERGRLSLEVRDVDLHQVGVGLVRPGGRSLRLLGGLRRGGRGACRAALAAPLVLRKLISQSHASLAQLAQYGPSLGWREACLVKGGPQLRKRQVTLASPALDEIIHSGRARLVIGVVDALGG